MASWFRMARRRLLCAAAVGSSGLFGLGCQRGEVPAPVAQSFQANAAAPSADAENSPAFAESREPAREPPANYESPVATPAIAAAPVGDNAAKDKTASEPPLPTAQRFAWLSPDGPVVVELQMTIDGQPFRAADERMIDEVLAAADRNRDGRATWGEVFADPQRLLGPRFAASLKFSNRREFMRAHDANRNGLVDRDEARRLVEQAKGSDAAFLLESAADYRQADLRRSIVRTMLDANADGALDAGELAGAWQRLLVVDANGDQIVAWTELDDSLAGDEEAAISRKRLGRSDLAAVALGGGSADGDSADGDSADGGSADEGEEAENREGRLTSEERQRLERLAPQFVVQVNLGTGGGLTPTASLVAAAPELGPVAVQSSPAYGDVALGFAGCRLRFAIDDRPGVNAEAPAMKAMDEKAPPAAPPLAAILAVIGNERDALFSLMDANHDDRLTPRELRLAIETLSALDADGDGRVALDEIPASATIWLGRGISPETAGRRAPTAAIAGAAAAPAWFLHMDANRDQEVGLDEFPGSREKFRALDLDGDGFIIAAEAQAAEADANR